MKPVDLMAGGVVARVHPAARQPLPLQAEAATPKDEVALGSSQPSFWQSLKTRVKKVGQKIAGAARTTSLAVPVLGSLAGAATVALLEAAITGEKRLSAVDWLRTRAPETYARDVQRLLQLASGRTERSIGLSVDNLLDIDKHFYRMLAPRRDAQGVKQPSEFLTKLGQAGVTGTSYVYLGEGREPDAERLMELWDSPQRPAQNPFAEGDDRAFVWDCLVEKAGKGELPIFMDLDGDPLTFTPTEHLARETLSSLVERSNTLGNGFSDPTLYYRWLDQRLRSNYQVLDPWLAREKPDLHQRLGCVKQGLTPPWLGAAEGLGPWPSPQNAGRAFETVKALGEPVTSSRTPAPQLADFADAAIALDRDMVTGVQSYWIKLLREVGSSGRKDLLQPLARAWVGLNLVPPGDPHFHEVAPGHGPRLTAVEKSGKLSHKEYDRAMALGEVVDHTLNGLGLRERQEFVTLLKDEVAQRSADLQVREGRMRVALGDRYAGMDAALAASGELTLENAGPGLAQLRELVGNLEDQQLSPVENSELQRHRDLMDWMASVKTRYGDVDLGLIPSAPCFDRDALAVSEYFDASQADVVTMLGHGPSAVEEVGDPAASTELPVSMVLEGGGGKGFAYLECLGQLRTALETSHTKVKVDEFVGTSAGAITAGLLAAGFGTDELAGVMEKLDFKKFNSDAMWLMGGVDPKVRGINRTGLFSMQRMYRTLYDLLSQKLDIQGRPVLFRDLPFKLKVTGAVLNTDLPPDDPLRRQIDPDGRLVMSSETTPNFDVVGAILASAAVPGFFNAPQMVVDRDGCRHRIQFCDGGVVDNLPVTAATRDDKAAMMMLPVHYQAVDPATGKEVALTTLNFDQSALPLIDAANRERYATFAPRIGAFLEEAQQSGMERLVLALNLAGPQDQSLPVLQGGTAETTESLHQAAERANLPRVGSERGRTFVDGMVDREGLGQAAGRWLFDAFLDRHEDRQERLEGGDYRVGRHEEEDILDILRGAGAAALAARTRRFETA